MARTFVTIWVMQRAPRLCLKTLIRFILCELS